jgi:hypothetical protein
MAVLQYPKKAQYITPAWSFGVVYLDGIYLDGNLFKNNMPILNGVIHISVTPTAAQAAPHSIGISFQTYQNGQVIPIAHVFSWLPLQGGSQLYDFNDNYPYGMGLNFIYIMTQVDLILLPNNIVYNVIFAYSMEV